MPARGHARAVAGVPFVGVLRLLQLRALLHHTALSVRKG